MTSPQNTRRSSFDNLDTEIPIEPEMPKETKKVNYCYIRIILINLIIFISLILLIIFLKIPKQKNEINFINIDKDYERIKQYDGEYIYIPIVATNDFHGVFFPEEDEYIYNNKKIKYKIGGLEYISKYISILKEEFGKDGILYLDSGDYFFGPYTPRFFDGNLIIDFFNLVGLNATTLGNHEFLWKKNWVEEKMKLFNFPVLINNIKEKNKNETGGIVGNGKQKNSEIFEINVGGGEKIKIGVIGLVLNLDVDKKFYDVGMKSTWNNISFQNYDFNLEKESDNLKQKGANAIIILSHVGINCTNNEENLKLKMYNQSTVQTKCEEKSPIFKLINYSQKKEKKLFDAIIAGDMHNQAHIWINDIPVISTNGKARNLNIMYLPFKKKDGKYIFINKEIKVEGPLPACEKIFSKKLNCEKIKGNYNPNTSGELINYYWRGKKIEKDNLITPLYEKYYNSYINLKKNFSFFFTGFNSTIKVDKLNEDNSIIEKLFLDVIKNITNADISILHKTMFISPVPPGGVTYENFMKIIPYSGLLCTVNLTGGDILGMIKKVQSGENAFHPTSGLKQYVKINKEGKKEILNVEIYDKDNKPNKIDINKNYILASTDNIFNEDSFDDFQQKDVLNIINNKLKKNLVKCNDKYLNQILYDFFLKKQIIDLSTIANDKNERIIFVK